MNQAPTLTEAPTSVVIQERPAVVQLKSEYSKPAEKKGATAMEQDTTLVAGQIASHIGNEVLAGKKDVDSEVVAELSDKNPDKAPFITYAYLMRPDFKRMNFETGSGIGVVLNSDGSYGVPQEGQNILPITNIIKKNGVFFECESTDGTKHSVPVEIVLGSQLANIGRQKEIKGVNTDQQTIIQAYSETMRGVEKSKVVTPEMLATEALTTGLVTAESLRTFAEKNGMALTLKNKDISLLKEGTDDEKAAIILKNKADNVKIQKNIDLFEGRTVAAPETVTQVIKTMLPDGISKSMISLEVESAKLTAQREVLKADDPQLKQKGEAIDAKQAEINQQINMLKEAQKFVDGDGEVAMMEIFGAVQRGEIPATKVAALDAALKEKENDPLKVISALSDTGNLNEEQKAEVKKYEGLYKAGKISIWVALGSIGMMVWQALKSKEGVGG